MARIGGRSAPRSRGVYRGVERARPSAAPARRCDTSYPWPRYSAAARCRAGEDRRCLFIGDFVPLRQAELEDVFPEDEYLAAVREAYPGVDLRFNATEKAMPEIIN